MTPARPSAATGTVDDKITIDAEYGSTGYSEFVEPDPGNFVYAFLMEPATCNQEPPSAAGSRSRAPAADEVSLVYKPVLGLRGDTVTWSVSVGR